MRRAAMTPRRCSPWSSHATIVDTGRPEYTLQDVLADWALPSAEVARDVFVVED